MEKLLQLEVELPPPRTDDIARLLRGEPPADRSTSSQPAASHETAPTTPRGARGLELVERAGLKTAVAWFFGTGAVGTAIPESADTIWSVLGLIMLGGFGVIAWAWTRRRARGRKREEVKRRVHSTLDEALKNAPAADDDGGALGSDHLKESAIDSALPDHEEYADFARTEAESYLTVRGPEIEAVESYIYRHPPPLPRAAKRMLNHARLLTRIAGDRGMFGGDPPLTPDHLGEWIVLRERWPWLVERVCAQPSEMARYEEFAAYGRDQLTEALAAQSLAGIDELHALLCTEPTLAPVIERLIRFQSPAPAVPAGGAAAAT